MNIGAAARAAIQRTVEQRRGVDELGRRLPPSPRALPLLGHYRGLEADPLGFLTRTFVEHGDVVRLHFLGLPCTLLCHPDHVERVLTKKQRIYTKQTRGYDRLRQFLGDGLLTSEGDFWRRQRRIAQPAFHKKRIDGFCQTMARAAEDVCARWEPYADTMQALDVSQEMTAVTLRVAGETLLSSDPSGEAEAVGRALEVVLREANLRIHRPLMIPEAVPTKRNRSFRAAAEALDRIVFDIIEERRRGGRRRDDLLQMLLEARDEETGEGMSDAQLRDEVMTIFLAGHETTANLMSWTAYLLSLAPEHGDAVHREAVEVLGERPVTVQDLPRLEVTERVLQESLRLRPPAWSLGRSPSEDDEIGGYRVEAGSLVFLSPWVTHRHPKFWTDPEGFDPDRWRPRRAAGMHRYQWFPFSAGPRMCIGAGFAMMEAKIMLATFLRRFRLDLVPGQRIEPEPLITLRPKGGVRMTVHRRGVR